MVKPKNRSSGRNRTYALAMPEHCSEQFSKTSFFMTTLLCQVYVCMHNIFFTIRFSLTKLNVVVCRYDAYTKCIIHHNVLLGSLAYIHYNVLYYWAHLLWQIFFVDRTDGQVFILPTFSMTSALVEKHASFPTSALVIEKIGKVARTDEQKNLPPENLSQKTCSSVRA